nr:uncharacterized protein LOC123002427 [Drosophila takahashii]
MVHTTKQFITHASAASDQRRQAVLHSASVASDPDGKQFIRHASAASDQRRQAVHRTRSRSIGSTTASSSSDTLPPHRIKDGKQFIAHASAASDQRRQADHHTRFRSIGSTTTSSSSHTLVRIRKKTLTKDICSHVRHPIL